VLAWASGRRRYERRLMFQRYRTVGRCRRPEEKKRRKIGLSVAPETIAALRRIAELTETSQGVALDRLCARELKRLEKAK
jgi:hypothetical protein